MALFEGECPLNWIRQSVQSSPVLNVTEGSFRTVLKWGENELGVVVDTNINW